MENTLNNFSKNWSRIFNKKKSVYVNSGTKAVTEALKILQSKVASLEKALSRSDEIAKEKLAMATKAAQAEKDRMEKTLRAEITAAKSLAANAKLSAQRELSSVLRDAEARAKRDLREQAKRAADERATGARSENRRTGRVRSIETRRKVLSDEEEEPEERVRIFRRSESRRRGGVLARERSKRGISARKGETCRPAPRVHSVNAERVASGGTRDIFHSNQ